MSNRHPQVHRGKGRKKQTKGSTKHRENKLRDQQRKQHRQLRAAELRETIGVALRERRVEPQTVVAHLGPTNSGKTHEALRFLAKEGKGIYAAPLRMLAREAYETLAGLLGDEEVGLLTGEEEVNRSAPILCVTTEMAPLSGHTLVLDEVQWARDPERGSSWSRLLAAGSYKHIRLLGAVDAEPLVKAVFPQARIEIHERLCPLTWCGPVHWKRLQENTVVIAFSRKAVLYLAQELAKHYNPQRVAALYGAMPLSARRREIQRVLDGEADLVVATDVLGHGVNLPCRTVLFAETNKFDGHSRREIEAWEAAQIGGRAGRYGQHEEGHVGVLTGLRWFEADEETAEAGLNPQILNENGHRCFRIVSRGRLRPRQEDIPGILPSELGLALKVWKDVAHEKLLSHPWLIVESTTPMRDRLQCAEMTLKSPLELDKLSLEQAWRLAISPLDVGAAEDFAILQALVRDLVHGGARAASLLPGEGRIALLNLGEAEQVARMARGLAWAAYAFPEVDGMDAERFHSVEEKAAEQTTHVLRRTITKQGLGRCKSCGTAVAPWYETCYRCRFGGGHWEDDPY